MDLADFTNSADVGDGYRYAFVAVDIFTKICHAVPISNKQPQESIRAMKDVFEKIRVRLNFDEVKDRGAKVRTGRLNVGKKAAGFSAGRLSDKLVSDIRKLNKDILKMSDKEILSNQKIINAMKINTNVNNENFC